MLGADPLDGRGPRRAPEAEAGRGGAAASVGGGGGEEEGAMLLGGAGCVEIGRGRTVGLEGGVAPEYRRPSAVLRGHPWVRTSGYASRACDCRGARTCRAAAWGEEG